MYRHDLGIEPKTGEVNFINHAAAELIDPVRDPPEAPRPAQRKAGRRPRR